MSTYELVIFAHVFAAVLLLGTSVLGEPAVRAAVRGAGHPMELRGLLDLGHRMPAISLASALLLLASGIYLSSVGHFWGLGWVQVSVVFWLVNGILAGVVVRPAIKRVSAETSAATGDTLGRELDDARWSGAWTWGVDAMAANDAAMLYLMIIKPGFAGSLAVVLLANVLVAAVRFLTGPHRQLPAPASHVTDA